MGSPETTKVEAKKARSVKNAEKRRERSKVAARCRRGKESEIFADLSTSLPIPESIKTGMDKASVMRLTLCNLKLKMMFQQVAFLDSSPAEKDHHNMDTALGGFGFTLVLEPATLDVIYASEGVSKQLGLSPYDIMGHSLLEFCHQYDHNDVRTLVTSKKDEQVVKREAIFRMKCTLSSRGRSANVKTTNFKTINGIGRVVEAGEWFIALCEPLLQPGDVDIPLTKGQTFLSKHSPDMKFEYVDDSVAMVLGYNPEELVDKSMFEFVHAEDGMGVAQRFKQLYEKHQTQTECYRWLAKGGGWVWITTQATVIDGGRGCAGKQAPSAIVCIHFIASGREAEDQILATVQMAEAETVDIPTEDSSPVVADPEEDIVDLLVGPLSDTATCSTAKIFAPKTKDMDTGFLVPVDDTLIATKDEPEDLTHLAPIAGDECVRLDRVPLLDDFLVALEASEELYSILDLDSDEIPKFAFTSPKDPPPDLSISPPPKAVHSQTPHDRGWDDTTSLPSSHSHIEMTVRMQDILEQSTVTYGRKHLEREKRTIPQSNPSRPGLHQISRSLNHETHELSHCPRSVSHSSILHRGGRMPKKIQLLDEPPGRSNVFTKSRRASSLSSSRSPPTASDSDSDSSGEKDNQYDLVDLGKARQLLVNAGLSLLPNPGKRKRNATGSLLSQRPPSLQELTRLDCEVNAPLSRSTELLQGPELLKALETQANGLT